METKREQKKRHFIYKQGGKGNQSELISDSNYVCKNVNAEGKFFRCKKDQNEKTVIIEFKTQGSLRSLENNCDDNSKKSDSISSSYYSSSSSSSSCEDSSYDVESENMCLKEVTKDKKGKGQERRCFVSFSENSSFYAQSGSNDFESDSLFNGNEDSDEMNYIEDTRKESEVEIGVKGNVNNSKNVLKMLMKDCIKLFSLNAYLYNDVFRYNPHLYGIYETCRSNEDRCEKIANFCAQFDLIFLRSVYGKYQLTFYEKLKNTHTVLLDSSPLSNVSCITEFFYTLQNYIGGNGGLFMCWRKKDFFLVFYDFIYLTSDLLVKRKVIKLIKLKYKDWYDLYFIHVEFDLFSTSSKLSNMDDLIILIKKTLWKLYVLKIFYKYRKFLKRKKEVQNNLKEMDKTNLIDEINRVKKEKKDAFSGFVDVENNLKENELRKEKRATYDELIFKKTSMFVIGSFNIDRKEMSELYNQLITLKNQGVLKDLFFYKNVHFKIQSKYVIVDRENSLVGGLNYCFGLTDNIFILERFTFHKDSINEMIYLFHPVDIIRENLQLLKKSEFDYHLENVLPLINRNCISLKFQNVYNVGVDILSQKKNNELSDHWGISAQFLLNSFNRKGMITVEQHLHNFFRNVHKYFVVKKNRYSSLCEVNSIISEEKREQKEKEECKKRKYDYSKRCIITQDNIHSFHKMDKELLEAMERCFNF